MAGPLFELLVRTYREQLWLGNKFEAMKFSENKTVSSGTTALSVRYLEITSSHSGIRY